MVKKLIHNLLCWYYYLKIRWIHYPRLKKMEEEDIHYEYHKNCFCDICIAKRKTL